MFVFSPWAVPQYVKGTGMLVEKFKVNPKGD